MRIINEDNDEVEDNDGDNDEGDNDEDNDTMEINEHEYGNQLRDFVLQNGRKARRRKSEEKHLEKRGEAEGRKRKDDEDKNKKSFASENNLSGAKIHRNTKEIHINIFASRNNFSGARIQRNTKEIQMKIIPPGKNIFLAPKYKEIQRKYK